MTSAIIAFTGAGGTGRNWVDGDTDGDRDVDTGDLTTAIINFTGAMAGASVVPEPGSFLLLVLGVVVLACPRRA